MVDLSEFYTIQSGLLGRVSGVHKRFLVDRINWDNRLLAIIGARGTGKTTLLLQHLAAMTGKRERRLYISADHVKLQAKGLYDTGADFFRLGGEIIVFDEVHKYIGWQQEVKNLYDAFPANKIFLSGSSTLAIKKGTADLSRRSVFYVLPGLSFREYLNFTQGSAYVSHTLDDLLNSHVEIAHEILGNGPILGHFRDYLDHGFYPYFLEGLEEYLGKLLNVIEKVLYEDIASVTAIRAPNIPVLKRMLWLFATSHPFVPNIDRMSRDLRISKEYIYTYMDSLERAGLINCNQPYQTGYRLVRKPAKIYIENTNLLKAITGSISSDFHMGSIREAFFSNQLKGSRYSLSIPKKGDFLVDSQFTFEIGGKGKTGKQIKAVVNSYLVKDDIDVGYSNVIPLWLFGFLY